MRGLDSRRLTASPGAIWRRARGTVADAEGAVVAVVYDGLGGIAGGGSWLVRPLVSGFFTTLRSQSLEPCTHAKCKRILPLSCVDMICIGGETKLF